MIKACIFDLDGTLMYTLPSIAYSTNQVFMKHGYDEIETDKFKFYVGGGAKGLIDAIVRDLGEPKDGTPIEDIMKEYLETFAVNYDMGNYKYDEIDETLSKLAQDNQRLTVFTNKPEKQAVEMMDRHFPGVFEIVVGQTDKMKRKPDPEGALYIANEIGIAPEEIMYIGDTDTDIQTGKNAGMFTVGVSWGYRPVKELTDNHADAIAYSPLELVEILKNHK